jgi:hypothetical protein
MTVVDVALGGSTSHPAYRNKSAPWSEFDPEAYFKKNYRRLRNDDARILGLTCEHFVGALADHEEPLRGVDVGAGVNLYPSMAMLPFCGSITLYEHAAPVVTWLKHQRNREWADSWGRCWRDYNRVLWRCGDRYKERGQVLERLDGVLRIRSGNIYGLEPRMPWDLGTMFFVAESITEDYDEFEAGLERFLGALKPGAPFVIALMEHRRGYKVAGRKFPSTDISKGDVERYFGRKSTLRDVVRIGLVDDLLDDDPYTGMLVARGWTK